MATGSWFFVVSCVSSYLVVWPIGSSWVSVFGFLSVFSPEWIRAPVIFASTSVGALLLYVFPFFLPYFLDTNYLVLWQLAFLHQLCIFFLAISPFLPKFFSFFVDWCPLDSNLPFCVFLCFKLVTSTLIVYLLTIGVLLPPIVIFSVLLCGLASLDSNLPFFFFGFSLFRFPPFCFFAFSLLAFCFFAFVIMRLPKNH